MNANTQIDKIDKVLSKISGQRDESFCVAVCSHA